MATQILVSFFSLHILLSTDYATYNPMPSLSIGAAVLVLGSMDELPWTSPTWQSLTESFAPPWETLDGAAPDAPSPHVPGWNTRTAQSVKSYVDNLRSLPTERAQVQYSTRGFSDNDSVGRSAWNTWIGQQWTTRWQLHKKIDEIFTENKCSPYQALARAKAKVVRSLCTVICSGQI